MLASYMEVVWVMEEDLDMEATATEDMVDMVVMVVDLDTLELL
uniref:Cuticular protein RR-2 motif n=1 Tax=Triatoma infestans TaxID=30076 RepID=A0A161MNT8_TRIIF